MPCVVVLAGCGTPLAEVSDPAGLDATTSLECPVPLRLGVANHGTGRLHATVSLDAGDAPLTLAVTPDLVLGGTDPTWWYWVNFDVTAAEAGEWTASVHIETNDPDHPVFDVPIAVRVADHALWEEPSEIDAGDVAVGESSQANVKLTNLCATDVATITAMDVDPTDGPWTLTSTTPVQLGGASSYQFTVDYAPTEPGDDEGVLRITGGSTEAAVFEIPLAGHAH